MGDYSALIPLDQDPRYEWLKSKACVALGCEYEDFDPLLRSEENVYQLRGFLDGGRIFKLDPTETRALGTLLLFSPMTES
eukprot:992772-Prorocentrum_minimum.AAC.3